MISFVSASRAAGSYGSPSLRLVVSRVACEIKTTYFAYLPLRTFVVNMFDTEMAVTDNTFSTRTYGRSVEIFNITRPHSRLRPRRLGCEVGCLLRTRSSQELDGLDYGSLSCDRRMLPGVRRGYLLF